MVKSANVKITQLQAENFKRVKVVQLTPAAKGLTIIGGDNNQGKTSVLDAIAWALGGDRFRPSAPVRDGSVIPPNIHIDLSNGLKVERSGKNSSLKVYDPSGKRGGQQLLNEFIETFALDLPKFINQSSSEKAKTLLRIIGIGDQLAALDQQERSLYNERLAIGRIANQKASHAKDMPSWEGVPSKPISAAELIQKQQNILLRNAENERLRNRKSNLETSLQKAYQDLGSLQQRIQDLENQLKIAEKDVEDLHDESTAELEESLRNIDSLNVKIRQNMEKTSAEDEADVYKNQYDELTAQIEGVRSDRMKLLNGADMPLQGLSVDNNELTYNGHCWDNMSGSEQLRVATAIVRRLNPSCGFVLLDKLEQMDMRSLTEFGEWLDSEGLQAIATRVSTGDECSIIIEDGYVKEEKPADQVLKPWEGGKF